MQVTDKTVHFVQMTLLYIESIDHGPSQTGNYLRVALTLVYAIYLRHLSYIFFLLLKKVERLGCKLSGYM